MSLLALRTRRLALFVAILAGVSLTAAACSVPANLPNGAPQSGTPSADVSDAAATVTLEYSSFEPSIITIKTGQSVEWMWDDPPLPHDVYFQQYIASGSGHAVPYTPHSIGQISGTWIQTFTKPGIYKYICTIHAGMVGEVIVEPASGRNAV